jgi:hypothetical protein
LRIRKSQVCDGPKCDALPRTALETQPVGRQRPEPGTDRVARPAMTDAAQECDWR